MIREIILKGGKYKYDLTYKHVKNINIRINSEQMIKVSASCLVPPEYIDHVLEKRADFILEAVRRAAEKEKKNQSIRYTDGSEIYYLGSPYVLSVVSDRTGRTGISDGKLVVYSDNSSECIKKEVRRWYDSIFHETIRPIEESAAERFSSYVSFRPTFSYRYMKSLWGSCNKTGKKITINKNLIKYDRKLIEFVYCHEYAHFIYPDHSPGFYSLLSEIMPDHPECRRKLREISEIY